MIEMSVVAIVFLPLLGAVLAGFLGTQVFKKVAPRPGFHGHDDGHSHAIAIYAWPQGITTVFLLVCALLSWVVFFHLAGSGEGFKVVLSRWIGSGDLLVSWALRVDMLTAVMLVVVTTVSALVHLYSIGYMSEDPHCPRFFAYLSLFTFFMLILVTADNLVQLFCGWEGVGLASYLLIGFWYQKPSANAAAVKAFVVNRVGDFGFALGIFLLWLYSGELSFDPIFAGILEYAKKPILLFGYTWDAVTVIGLLLFMGAMGKSAQFFLHTWLPDAMEGPTPVSALIHAATMVTAGVFLVARLSPVYEFAPTAQQVILVIGSMTAFFAATVGLVQNDIKRVIAYSTCSQLGYMFAALGVGAYGVGIFHLFTHAFFKALLFLGAGSVIHALSGEQDLHKMGGIGKHVPKTFAMMLVGTLALTGFPLTAGYFSKDAIMEAVYAAGSHGGLGVLPFLALLVAAVCTSFYSWRLVFLTFYGKPRASQEVMSHVHESPSVMLIPLYVLAAGALFAGWAFKGWFIGENEEIFWGTALYRSLSNTILEHMHHVPAWVVYAPFGAMVLGFIFAYLFYCRFPKWPGALARQQRPLYLFLLNKWYFDELYRFIFVRPMSFVANVLWKRGDGMVIDGFGPDGVSRRILDGTRALVRAQTGYMYHYAFWMLIGIVMAVTYVSGMGR